MADTGGNLLASKSAADKPKAAEKKAAVTIFRLINLRVELRSTC